MVSKAVRTRLCSVHSHLNHLEMDVHQRTRISSTVRISQVAFVRQSLITLIADAIRVNISRKIVNIYTHVCASKRMSRKVISVYTINTRTVSTKLDTAVRKRPDASIINKQAFASATQAVISCQETAQLARACMGTNSTTLLGSVSEIMISPTRRMAETLTLITVATTMVEITIIIGTTTGTMEIITETTMATIIITITTSGGKTTTTRSLGRVMAQLLL